MSTPFKMKGYTYPGTSPVKSIGGLIKAVKAGYKVGKKLFTKAKPKQTLPKSKSADFKGTLRSDKGASMGSNYPVGKRGLTHPGKLGSVNQPNFMSYTSEALKQSQKTWFPGMKLPK
tara:strand:+ start:292 stop:642 length:351 start_codon:yes stop_codon:yes gene_type:complete